MTTFIDLDSTFRNRTTNPDPSSFITLVSSAASSADKNDDDPVCDSMPVISWTGGQFSTISEGLVLAGTIVLNKSSDFVVVLSKTGGFQKATNYYRGAILQFANDLQRRITAYNYLPSGDGEFIIDSPAANYSDLNVFLIEPSDYSNDNGLEVFVPGGSPISDFYNGMYFYNEFNGDYRRVTLYRNFIAYLETTLVGPPAVVFNQSFSIRKQPPITSVATQPSLSTTSRIKFGIANNEITSENVGYFLRNSSLKYGNAANANVQIVPRIIAWDETLKIATVSPPFAINPPINTTLELLPITYFNFHPFTNIRYSREDKSYFYVKLLSLNVPQNSNITKYPYVYVSLTSIHTSTGKNLLISNNSNATLAQFRATLTSADKSNTFCKLSGDDSVQLLQINTNDALQFKIILPDGKNLIYVEKEAFSPAPPNPLVQVSAFFSISLQSDKSTAEHWRNSSFATV